MAHKSKFGTGMFEVGLHFRVSGETHEQADFHSYVKNMTLSQYARAALIEKNMKSEAEPESAETAVRCKAWMERKSRNDPAEIARRKAVQNEKNRQTRMLYAREFNAKRREQRLKLKLQKLEEEKICQSRKKQEQPEIEALSKKEQDSSVENLQ